MTAHIVQESYFLLISISALRVGKDYNSRLIIAPCYMARCPLSRDKEGSGKLWTVSYKEISIQILSILSL